MDEKDSNALEARAFCNELEALLDLACYAAAQAVAFSKELERQQNRLSTADADSLDLVIEERRAVLSQIVSLRKTIEQLHRLLKSARAKQELHRSRSEWEPSNRVLEELLSAEDLREIEQSLRNLKPNTAGGEP